VPGHTDFLRDQSVTRRLLRNLSMTY